MSPSPSSSVRSAKQALGKRLREIRKDSGKTARAVAAAAGWHESKSSRLENGKTPPSDEDIRIWTRICDAEDQAADLIATARGIDGMYVEWRRLESGGLKRVQESVLPLFQRTLWFRFYQSWVVPGLLQTEDYTRAVLNTVVSVRDTVDDAEEAVAARMERQRVLHAGGRRFAFLIEEWVLRTVIGDAETMVTQLGHLIGMTATPAVSLGVIPMGVVRGNAWPTESFAMYDEAQVSVELVSAGLTVTQPREIADYGKAFAELASIAAYGAAARKLITTAIDTCQ
ncbi:helix-turn-helix domain-containing protein [Streptomyces flavofungini]|uniref:Helix-turn-helix transcriptional regulator n=1 Tax=Streptomyces flavofungini TaxID=68200 RepID=A0ABS0X0J0_9ACTN|nr:helix-turn-helix transcriptional regulator [Streptomyces flavofungini]MBJ3806698.1 helix-turn-helix transcriptional regulator [Streptomyces flavofungini]GHC61149.1 transcriptional regulator [Streptomyces flavofungini]